LNETQKQISSGKKILTPADDPSGSARVLGLDQQIKQTEQFQKNISFAKSRMNIEESALGSANDILSRAHELIIRGASGTNDADSRSTIAKEIRESINELVNLANTKDLNNEYIFAGNVVKTAPFSIANDVVSYGGDQSSRLLQVSDNKTAIVSDPGSEIFMGFLDVNGAPNDVFKLLDDFATSMESNTVNDDDVDDVNLAIDHLLRKRAEVGARESSLEVTTSINEDQIINFTGIKAEIEEVDIVSAIAQFQQQNVALQAAQSSFSKLQSISLFQFI
ncbi:MAG: flagellar hook-associated protein FlgL, partial [Methylococcales bacterium]|nr:flagellar hook-associated protein FlgL [Methylococcales bacterium]